MTRDKRPKEHCPWCNTTKALTKKGVFRFHDERSQRHSHSPCRGSGRFPADAKKAFTVYDAACKEQEPLGSSA